MLNDFISPAGGKLSNSVNESGDQLRHAVHVRITPIALSWHTSCILLVLEMP
jgi:hypothetical protein